MGRACARHYTGGGPALDTTQGGPALNFTQGHSARPCTGGVPAAPGCPLTAGTGRACCLQRAGARQRTDQTLHRGPYTLHYTRQSASPSPSLHYTRQSASPSPSLHYTRQGASPSPSLPLPAARGCPRAAGGGHRPGTRSPAPPASPCRRAGRSVIRSANAM